MRDDEHSFEVEPGYRVCLVGKVRSGWRSAGSSSFHPSGASAKRTGQLKGGASYVGPGARRMPLFVGSERMPRGQDNTRIRATIVRAAVLRPDESILAYAGGATADLRRAGFDGEDRVPRRGRR
jgi:hypothetical protein